MKMIQTEETPANRDPHSQRNATRSIVYISRENHRYLRMTAGAEEGARSENDHGFKSEVYDAEIRTVPGRGE